MPISDTPARDSFAIEGEARRLRAQAVRRSLARAWGWLRGDRARLPQSA